MATRKRAIMPLDVIVGYVHGARTEQGRDYDSGNMTVLAGNGGPALAHIRIKGSWRVQSWIGSRMYAYEGLDASGRRYHGRGFGNCMIVRLYPNRRKANAEG